MHRVKEQAVPALLLGVCLSRLLQIVFECLNGLLQYRVILGKGAATGAYQPVLPCRKLL